MILWWRKAVDDLAGCPADKVTDAADKLETVLDGHRATENYYDSMLAKFKEEEESNTTWLFRAMDGFLDDEYFKDYVGVGGDIGILLLYMHGLVITSSDCPGLQG